MVYEIFVRLINMGITASVVIIAVLIARLFMGRLPKKYSYILWAIVAVRLLCPIGISSSFSVFNLVGEHMVLMNEFQGEPVLEWGARTENHQNENQVNDISSGKEDVEADVSWKSDAGGKYAAENQRDIEGQSHIGDLTAESKKANGATDGISSFLKYGAAVWIGIGVMIVAWNFLLMVLMRRKVSKAVRLRDNIYECDNIPSPFVMGFVRPKIYIPFRLEEEKQAYIIRHEQHHVARRDNVIKLVAFLLTCVYWFHPLVWFSYFLMIRDMEMSCDEYVLQKSARDIREDYSRSLLGFATNQRNMGVGLIAFGESGARKRVKHIMKFKKCGKWIGMIAIGMVLVVGASCLTDARKGDADNADQAAKNGSENNDSASGNSENAGWQSQEMGNSDNQNPYAVVAKAKVGEYQLEIQCISRNNTEEAAKSYCEGDSLAIQTSRGDETIDRHEVIFAKDEKIYFPVTGFHLQVADYDGDGEKNDFALGQGQTPDPMLGNYMRYRFFGVERDGTVVDYHTSTEDGVTIGTIPGEYSPLFKRKNGELKYTGLREDGGGAEERFTSIVRYIWVEEAQKEKQEPMNSIMDGVRRNMPSEVVKELQDKGVWHVSRGEGEEIQYSLANGENGDDITLRLDFTYRAEQLIQYTSKEYGFTEEMKTSDAGDWYERLSDFARDFANDDFNRKKKYKFVISRAEIPQKWDDGNHACFRDVNGATYLVDNRINMVVGYERNGM